MAVHSELRSVVHFAANLNLIFILDRDMIGGQGLQPALL